MALAPGTRLGSYEVTAQIGVGGMGEVYRATDTNLKRQVAIKVLPASVAGDAERLARFQREAEVLAALNHPNIAAIYGLEKTPGFTALVMELVEGEDLSQRIARGAIPLDEALPIAKQIAEALEAAHEQGIVHRDLKPANVKVRADGTVKVLDFGLAKAMEPTGAAAAHASQLPTITTPAMTQAGMILGTAAYMSPEQARGKAVDKRADIWAFGAVLFEMLTGTRAFAGDDVSITMASVLMKEPEWAALPAGLSPALGTYLRRCLQKDPRQRVQAIGDVRLALEGAFETTAVPVARSVPARSRALMPWALAVAAALVAVAGWLRAPSSHPAAAPRALVSLAPTGGLLRSTPLIAPDGSAVVFEAASGMLYRRLETDDPAPAPVRTLGKKGFWADDSTTFIYFDPNDRVLKKVRLPDGAPEPLAEPLPGGIGVPGAVSPFGSRSTSGTVLFTGLVGRNLSLVTVPASGGRPAVVTFGGAFAAQGSCVMSPQFVDGSEDFLFFLSDCDVSTEGSNVNGTYVATLREGMAANPVRLMPNETTVVYTPASGGRLLFVRDDNLYAQSFDRVARAVVGEPVLVQRGVASSPANWEAYFSVSRAGTAAFRPGRAEIAQVTTLDRTGVELGVSGAPEVIGTLRLARDETRLLAGRRASAWLLEPGRPGRTSLREGHFDTVWLPPAGTSVLAVRVGGDGPRLIELPPVGTGAARELPTPRGFGRIQDVSPDGRILLFNRGPVDTAVFAAPLDGSGGEPRSLVQTGESILNTRFAPDGRWIVYATQQAAAGTMSGATLGGLYAQPLQGSGLRQQIASRGNRPVWRRDGREILYVDQRDGRTYVMSIPVTWNGPEPRFGEPSPLFPFRPPGTSFNDMNYFDVSADGSRIYIAQGVAQPDADVIHLRSGPIE